MNCENTRPYLSEYLDELTKIILSCGGTVDKYIGDGIMAFWGAPLADEKHAEHAVRAAILCRRKLRELNARWAEEGKPLLHTRIGIHTGETVVGNLGSSERMNYSLLGDSVNLAARLEGVNKVYGTSVLVSEPTYERLGEGFVTRPIDYVVVKGKSRRVKVFEVMDLKDEDADPERVALAERCTEAFTLYRERAWEKCVALLEEVLENHTDDVPSARLLERCKDFIDNPPEERTWCERIDGK
jgi:adenylate cyclase